MTSSAAVRAVAPAKTIKALTCLMFFMFAMTTDSIGLIIPQVIAEFKLGLTTAGSLQYATMLGIAGAGLGLGFLADRYGRKRTIVIGLGLFAATAYLFPAVPGFGAILVLTLLAGVAIGVFKTGALALVGDISATTTAMTATMNLVEGCFGVGAIVGPLIVTALLQQGASWRWLYVVAGTLCLVLLAIALATRYPIAVKESIEPRSLASTLRLIPSPFALGFSLLAFSYVVVECAIYVWMPTLLIDYRGQAVMVAAYALPAFFVMRALGRFLGAWLLSRVDWSLAIALCSLAILCCFCGSVLYGLSVAIYLLPLSGLFMSILYPTINSKGIGCFDRSHQGSVAGIILFFTCAGAFLGPLAMGLVSDRYGGLRYGFILATAFAALLFLGLAINWYLKPAHRQLERLAENSAPTI